MMTDDVDVVVVDDDDDRLRIRVSLLVSRSIQVTLRARLIRKIWRIRQGSCKSLCLSTRSRA